MHLGSYCTQLDHAVKHHDGPQLARLVSLDDKHADQLLAFLARPDRGPAVVDRTLDTPYPSYAAHFKRTLAKDGPWADIATAHLWALVALNPPINPVTGQLHSHADAVVAYHKQHEVVTALYRWLIDARDLPTGWALPLLYVVCRDLRKVAEQADQQLLVNGQKATKLEDASRLLQKCFSCCLNDRASDIMASRKMGTYYLASLLFKTYFRLNSTALCKNIIRGIDAADLPPLTAFPRAHRVTYTYYMAVFAFLREDYSQAEKGFVEALGMTHRKMKRNIELILDYLIPLVLLRGVFPSPKLLARSARHKTLYEPFVRAVRDGDFAAYERQLEHAQKRLMERGTYLVVERAREAAVRGLLKKAWVLEGKPARLGIETFRSYYNAAQAVGLEEDVRLGRLRRDEVDKRRKEGEIDGEEMECLLANMIYKNLLKGYISHSHQLVVLSKDKPFPWYPPYRNKGEEFLRVRAERETLERKKVVQAAVASAGGAAAALHPSTSAASRASAPAPPAPSGSNGVVLPGDGALWSAILDSAKGSRSTASRRCFVLGAHNAGKSTLIDRLRSPSGEAGKGKAAVGDAQGKELDLGMSYEVVDVRDEGDEGDTLARLGLFQLSSPLPPYPALLSLALSRDSLILICLDWERPWEFVRQLEAWVALLDELLRARGRDGKEKEWEAVEGRERLEAFVRSYAEPSANGAPAPSASSSAAAAHFDVESPLPPGTLTDNLGIGLVFVCTKTDHMNSLEREREFTEEQFDYVQQTLRTIALRYGAAVFYTAQTLPGTFAKLRQYILHRLFTSPSPTSALAPPPSSAQPVSPSNVAPRPAPTGPTSALSTFPFPYRANVVDRDAVFVPAGWDSWSKIRILRERFDCEAVGAGWEADLARRRGEEEEADVDVRGLENEYGMVVVDFDAEDQTVNLAHPVAAHDEQSFLREHYDTLQADTAADPRLAFRQPVSASSGGAHGLGPSVVGPMAGTSLDLPTVMSTMERARERGDPAAAPAPAAAREERYRAGAMSRQNSSASAGVRSPPLGSSSTAPSPTLSSTATYLDRPSSSARASAPAPAPASAAAGAAAGGNQVLADFFQSLLTARTAGAGAGAGAAAGVGASASASANASAVPGAPGLRASAARGTPPLPPGASAGGAKGEGK
ncbi:hypothetical protein JCM3770_005797 [Rhodotorula araucariae]